MDTLQKGMIVKYSKPQDEKEKTFRFILLNDPKEMERENGTRVEIQYICDWLIQPIERVDVSEIEPATD